MPWPITAKELRDELRYKPDQGDTDDLNFYAAMAVERIEEEVGKCSGQIIETHVHGPASRVRLTDRAARIESITVDGTPLDVTAFRLEVGAIIHGRFPAGSITILTEAPRTTSTLVEGAARRLAKLWFQQSRNGPGAQPNAQDAAPGIQGIGIPRVVAAMLEGRTDLPGMA